MTELVEMLHKEEAGLTTDRSLDGAPSNACDVQSFQIFLTAEWRQSFDKMYNTLVRAPSVSEIIRNNQASTKGLKNTGGLTQLPPDRCIKAWSQVSVFLQEFVDNNFGPAGLRRVIRDPTYQEDLFDNPPDLTGGNLPCVFLTDRKNEYTRALFLGREYDLILMNILSYAIFDLWFESMFISVLFTYMLDWFLCMFREKVARTMIARKTLVDERFLF